MSGVTVRRGLPRVAGGEPWPPGDLLMSAPVATSAPVRPRNQDDPVAAEASTPLPAEVVAPSTMLSASLAQDSQADAEALHAVPALRQGLPRVAGGDPWPPQHGSAAATAAAAAAAAPAPEAAQVSAAMTPRAAVSNDEAPVSRLPRRAATGAGNPIVPRRGLPRIAGGDGWPPADFVAAGPPPAAAPSSAPVQVPKGPEVTASGAPLSGAQKRQRVIIKSVVGLVLLVLLAFLAVIATRALLATSAMQDFLADFPGEYHLPPETESGFPAWVRWSHFLNMFFMVLIVRSGLQVRRQKKPPAYWTSKRGAKISINLWLHQSLDILWMVNGVAFMVLIFATGHWARIVPTSWEVFPNALSALLQYVSLDWPTENGWVNYNSLQQLAYFTTVFIAAPLAALSGVRMSGVWPKDAKNLSKIYPIELARAIHFPTMLYFVVFVIFHVGLVFATGALRNLNHMYAGQDTVSWAGFWIMVASVAAVIAAWIAARPLVLAPIASLFGRVSER